MSNQDLNKIFPPTSKAELKKNKEWFNSFMKSESEWMEEIYILKEQIKRLKKKNKQLSEINTNTSRMVFDR